MNPHVFTIPASAPFLPTLIEALNAGRLGFAVADDPLALAAATIYLPTRRACRLMRDAFLDAPEGDAAILPRIVALGDIDEDEIAFAERRDRGDRRRGARAAGGARRTRTAAVAHAAYRQVGSIPRASRRERHAANRPDTGCGLRARRRSCAADRRHDDARRVLGPARQSRAGSVRRLLAADAEISADRA